MQSVEAPTSRDYDCYLLEALSQPQAAALYLTALLEEVDPEPVLLPFALMNVAKALGPDILTVEALDRHLAEIDKILSEESVIAIYQLATWLDALGLQLTVVVKPPN